MINGFMIKRLPELIRYMYTFYITFYIIFCTFLIYGNFLQRKIIYSGNCSPYKQLIYARYRLPLHTREPDIFTFYQ